MTSLKDALPENCKVPLRALKRVLVWPVKFIVEWPARERAAHLRKQLDATGQPVTVVDGLGHKFLLYSDDDLLTFCRMNSITDATHICRYVLDHVQPGWTCVDIGANFGAVSVALWKRAGASGKVISIEADPENVARIEANLMLNGCPAQHIVNVAVAESERIAQFKRFRGANGWQTMGMPAFASGHEFQPFNVRCRPFTDIAAELGLDKIDFLKIDVEGAEVLVFKGMHALLEARKIQNIVFEVNQPTLQGMNESVDSLFSLVKKFPYDLFQVTAQGKAVPMQGRWDPRLYGDCLAVARR